MFDRFYDPDIEDTSEKYDVIYKYEWAFSDFGTKDKLYSEWKSIPGITSGTDKVIARIPIFCYFVYIKRAVRDHTFKV